jgi:hypothetical protein
MSDNNFQQEVKNKMFENKFDSFTKTILDDIDKL